MKKTYLIMMGLALIMASCSDESVSPSPTIQQEEQEEPELSTLQKLAQEWVLVETFENGVQKTSNGTKKYMFTEEGGFFFGANDNWNAIGSYTFENSDSLYISVLFNGLDNPVIMQLETLSEDELKTEFVTNGSTLNYNYVR